MVREYKSERFDIPESSRTVKAWFPTRESAEAEIEKIHRHLDEGNYTFTYPGHTHTAPPKGAVPVYIGTFKMSEKLHRSRRETPCPCCWEAFGRFLGGMIAWFPQEKVIRLVGRDCFRALDPEAHESAKRLYRDEQEAKNDRNHLLSNIPKLRKAIGVIEQAAEVAGAVEQFRTRLHEGLRRSGLVLWQHVREGGSLKVWAKSKEFRPNADGTTRVQEVDILKDKFRLHGFAMLDPEMKPLAGPLAACARHLRPYNFGDRWQAELEAMDDAGVSEACKVLNAALNEAVDLIRKVEDMRRFVETVNVNSLKSWGAHSGCPIKVHFASHLGRVSFGRHDDRDESVDIPPPIFAPIPPLDFWTPRQKVRRGARQQTGEASYRLSAGAPSEASL